MITTLHTFRHKDLKLIFLYNAIIPGIPILLTYVLLSKVYNKPDVT
jgi:hypothetical protein